MPAALRWWQTTVLLSAAFAVTLLALGALYAPRVLLPGRQGFLGYTATPSSFHRVSAHHLTAFEPESPLPAAGVQVGDLIMDPPRGVFLAGQPVELTVAHQGSVRQVRVSAVPIERFYTPVQTAVDLILDAFILGLGLLIALRRRRDVGALVLALGFCIAALPLFVDTLPVHRLGGLVDLCNAWLGVLFLPIVSYFVLSFEGGYRSRTRPWILRATIGFTAVFTACVLAVAPYYFGRVWIQPAPLFYCRPVLMMLGIVLCLWACLDTWRHVEGERRDRLRWFFAGIDIGLANLVLVIAGAFGLFGTSSTAIAQVGLAQDTLMVLAALALSYSVLKQHVVDLGFAISRALVFAIFTGALLICFGVAEWVADHSVYFRQRESSVVLDGAIAVALYLVFHRVRRSVERLVERTFFRSWHLKEEALQRFLKSAPHFSAADTLAAAWLAAVDAFAGARGSAIYRRQDCGRFLREHATLAELPPAFDPDAPLIVEMKTFGEPVHLTQQFALPGAALAVPLVRRTELTGILLVGRKLRREAFRPDEVTHLMRAAREVSLDLYVLQAEGVERHARELELQNAALRGGLTLMQTTHPPESG